MVYLPDYVEYQFVPAPPLRSLFPMASDDALDLLSKLFTYDPKTRISAQQALEHRYAVFSIFIKSEYLHLLLVLCLHSYFHLGTSHLDHRLQNQLSSLDLTLREKISMLGFQI